MTPDRVFCFLFSVFFCISMGISQPEPEGEIEGDEGEPAALEPSEAGSQEIESAEPPPVEQPREEPVLESGAEAVPADSSHQEPDNTSTEAEVETQPDSVSPESAADTSQMVGDSLNSSTESAPEPVMADSITLVDSAIVPDSSLVDSLAPAADSFAGPDTLRDSVASAEPDGDSTDLDEESPAAAPVKKKREAVYRSSRINTIDDMKGQYKSPKRAMFMSLLVPGLGQAYVGNIPNYIRAGAYVLIEGGLFIGWHHYVVTKHDRQVRRYRRYADEHWSHERYEEVINDVLGGLTEDTQRDAAFPTREAFCSAVFGSTDPSVSNIGSECATFGDFSQAYTGLAHYQLAQAEPEDLNFDQAGDPDSIGPWRERTYSDLHDFYELVGKHNEYLPGWQDFDPSGFDSVFTGENDFRTEYRRMRQKATDYSRMQVWFLGGVVVNHLISALDAAITARFHNKRLYQTEVRWFDRLRLDSYVSLLSRTITTHVNARIPF